METAIQIIWWIGLLGALIATLAILKLVTLVVGALQDIYELAERTRVAAEGIGEHVAVIPELGVVERPAVKVREATAQVVAAAGLVEQALASLVPVGRRE